MKRKQEQLGQIVNISPVCDNTSTSSNTNSSVSREKKRPKEQNENWVLNHDPSIQAMANSNDDEDRGAESDLDLSAHTYNLRSKNPPELVDDFSVDADNNTNTNNNPIRLQQPPAYINANLRKIKLESDYIPVAKVKQEMDENMTLEIRNSHDEIEDEKEDEQLATNSSFISTPSNHHGDENNNESDVVSVAAKLQSALNNGNGSEVEVVMFAQELQHIINSISTNREAGKNSGSKTEQLQNSKQLEAETEPVVVKLETVVNNAMETAVTENETEQKEAEEKETVESLEGRINKYAHKVISLHREKKEIQRTLQKKIDESNLVMGEQEAKIRDLHSVLSQTETEKNQLNSQVNLQQNQIHELKTQIKTALKNGEKGTLLLEDFNLLLDQQEAEIEELNSTVHLQRHENKELTLKVNLQQNQIHELKDKLKVNAENQCNAVELNMYKIPTKVLSHIFAHLDMNSLKASRFVCCRWRKEAGKILLQNFYLVHDYFKTCDKKALSTWLGKSTSTSSSISKSRAAARKLWSKQDNFYGTLEFMKRIPWSFIRELKISSFPLDNDKVYLYEILQLLPKLEVLEMKTFDMMTCKNWSGHANHNFMAYRSLKIDTGSREPCITKMQTLKKLKLHVLGTGSCFLEHDHRISLIDTIELEVDGMSFIRGFLNQRVTNWEVTRLTLNLSFDYDIQLIRTFLILISPVLQYLKFRMTRDTFSVSKPGSPLLISPASQRTMKTDPWEDDWIIPAQLNRVETLEIEMILPLRSEIVAPLNQFMLKSIIAALQLERLKNLALFCVPWRLEEIIYDWNWNYRATANGRKVKSESLEELQLLSQFATSTLILHGTKIPSNPWPGMKSLKCSWKNPESFDASVLSELRNLERLELTIGNEARDDPGRKSQEDESNSSTFHLRDLQKLKSFSLKVPENEQRYQDFANGLVQRDLKLMKSLQYVQFHRVAIDPEPLKSTLGPHVPIIFTS